MTIIIADDDTANVRHRWNRRSPEAEPLPLVLCSSLAPLRRIIAVGGKESSQQHTALARYCRAVVMDLAQLLLLCCFFAARLTTAGSAELDVSLLPW